MLGIYKRRDEMLYNVLYNKNVYIFSYSGDSQKIIFGIAQPISSTK